MPGWMGRVACLLSMRSRMAAMNQLVGISNCECAHEEHYMDDGLLHQNFDIVVASIDECFEEMNRADTNDGQCQFDLQHRGIDVI